MKRASILAGFLLVAGCAPKAENVVRAPNVLLVDDSLLGQTQAALEERLGPACYTTEQGVGWNMLQNTVMSCGFPTGQVFAVYMRDGKSIGYYVGEW